MKKKLKLKKYVVPTLYVALFFLTFYFTLVFSNSLSNQISTEEIKDNNNYVNESIVENNVPVIKEEENIMIKPYINENVKIGKYYYDYKSESERQENSITYHNNTYMQNSGIDYVDENVFDVVSVLDGTVTDVKTDDLLGNIVEIKHDKFISTYQSLSEVSVKKGDTVSKGQVIGKSGTNELDKEMNNHLHFELYVNGSVVDPLLYIDKDIKSTNN